MDDKDNGIVLTLNGGRKEMDSATIPVAWWLSDKVIETNPQYLIIVEQNERESDCFENWWNGRRYICKITDVVKFIPVFSSGRHRLMVVVISGDEKNARETAQSCLVSGRGISREYNHELRWRDDLVVRDVNGVCVSTAVAIEEFEVPRELFAQKPKSGISKLVWNWTNMFWDGRSPRDECDYRRRKIFAFTIQPVMMICWWLFCFFVGLSIAAYFSAAAFCVFFAGFRPRPIGDMIWRAFTILFRVSGSCEPLDWSIRRFSPAPDGETYRLWSITKSGEKIYLKLAPWEIFLAVVLGGVVIAGLQWFTGIVFAILLGAAAALIVGWAVVGGLRRLLRRAGKKWREWAAGKVLVEQRRQEHWRAIERLWLVNNLRLSNKTETVDLKHLPDPPNFGGKVVQKFRVSYWSLKARVCRPFAK